jgi:hypothetical protein
MHGWIDRSGSVRARQTDCTRSHVAYARGTERAAMDVLARMAGARGRTSRIVRDGFSSVARRLTRVSFLCDERDVFPFAKVGL